MDRGAWWAAVYGIAQGQTWLKRLSSSSRSSEKELKFQVGYQKTTQRNKYRIWRRGMQAYLSLLHFSDTAFFANWFVATLPWTSPAVPFSNSVCSLLVSVSHFGYSCNNISNFFIIMIFIMVICDQGSLIFLQLLWGIPNCTYIQWWT